ncbi:MAG: hypothetical protein KDG54_19375 [Geminicoccaceae bacterium]|nr:hypothetical protein [Geminicoccaceae bacterium]
MEVITSLQQQVDTGAQSVTIPRSDALAIIELLRERDRAEQIVDTTFPPQQRTLFYAMRERLGEVFAHEQLTEIIEIPDGAVYMAIWRLAKLVSYHLTGYQVASVTGAGWMLRKVE